MEEQKCKICGCTDYNACEGSCYWVAEELCSKCADGLINQNENLQQELSIANDKLKKIEEYIKNKQVIDLDYVEKIIEGND